MPWWGYYLVGAVLGLLQVMVPVWTNPLRRTQFEQAEHKGQGLAAQVLFGALMYGSVLVVVLGMLFNI